MTENDIVYKIQISVYKSYFHEIFYKIDTLNAVNVLPDIWYCEEVDNAR